MHVWASGICGDKDMLRLIQPNNVTAFCSVPCAEIRIRMWTIRSSSSAIPIAVIYCRVDAMLVTLTVRAWVRSEQYKLKKFDSISVWDYILRLNISETSTHLHVAGRKEGRQDWRKKKKENAMEKKKEAKGKGELHGEQKRRSTFRTGRKSLSGSCVIAVRKMINGLTCTS